MTRAITARGLSKRYRPVKAVVDIDLDMQCGEIYGFLGRNGAGKTTTIRMLLGLVRPSAGEISILGSSLGDDRAGVLARVGSLVESAAAYPNLTVRENLRIQIIALAIMSLCCAVLVAWVAVETRGYFAPLGFSILTLVLANVFRHTDWEPWVPWTIVGLYSGAAGPAVPLGWGSFALIAATFLVGTGLTIRHEMYADNMQ